ncbi:MAG: N-formylglutamate amidohydrolase [Burkholderiales bacterium]
MKRPDCVVVSCEHGGNRVPPAYAPLFSGHAALLGSHRGWDPGALPLARQLARAFAAPLFAATTTRLLIDLNRSIGHRELYSELTRGLPRAERQAIAERHYRPHRDAVEGEIAHRIHTGQRVIHIASHSFTAVLHGVVRADVAWLYDPQRAGELALARRWQAALAQRAPGLSLRRNHPYQGRSDGLTTLLRKRFDAQAYVGIELEVNQRFVATGASAWAALRSDLVAALRTALADKSPDAGAPFTSAPPALRPPTP